jgi:hypothetical protein
VREVGGDRDHRDAGQRRRVLGRVDRLAAADADQRLVRPGAQVGAEVHRRVDGAAVDLEDVGQPEGRGDVLGDRVALAAADRDRDPALGGDPAVGQQLAEGGDGPAPHVDGQGGREHPGQEGHARQ